MSLELHVILRVRLQMPTSTAV